MANIPTAPGSPHIARPRGLPMAPLGVRSITLGPADIAGAVDPVTLDPQGYVSEARGGAALGEGLQQVSQAGQALARAQMEAIDISRTSDARLAMEEAAAEIDAAIMAEPDETKWRAVAADYLTKNRSKWTPDKLSPAAAESFHRELQGWENRIVRNTVSASRQRSFKRAGAALEADALRAAESGMVDAAKEILSEGTEKGYWLPDYEARMGLRAEETAERKRRESLYETNYEAILADPDAWTKANRKPAPGMEPGLHYTLTNLAQEQSREKTREVSAQLADALVTPGQIKTEEDIERLAAGQLSKAGLAKIKSDWRDAQSEAFKARLNSRESILTNTGRLETMIDEFDPAAKDARDARIGIEYEIRSLLPEGYREDLLKDLDRKWKPPAVPEDPTVRSWARGQIAEWYGDGKFGSTRMLVPLTEGDAGYYPGTTARKWADNPPERDKAMLRRGEVTRAFSDWLQKNPEATFEEAQKALLNSAKQNLLPRDVDALLKTRLPETPAADGGPDASLFPDGSASPASDAAARLGRYRAAGKVTSFGYADDPHGDSLTRAGKGAWSGNRNSPLYGKSLDDDSLAVSPDIEARFAEAGIEPGDRVELELEDGTRVVRRFDDRTIQDAAAVKRFGRALTGRFDFHSSKGPHAKDGQGVRSFRKAAPAAP